MGEKLRTSNKKVTKHTNIYYIFTNIKSKMFCCIYVCKCL
nr:MAG TPA: hypothetical protein [Caudoviricetes sp.]